DAGSGRRLWPIFSRPDGQAAPHGGHDGRGAGRGFRRILLGARHMGRRRAGDCHHRLSADDRAQAAADHRRTGGGMTGYLTAALVRLLTGLNGRWRGCAPDERQRVYFANHTSNLDGPALWAALPPPVRELTRMVAARDYWDAGPIRRHFARNVFNAVLI